MFYIKKQKTRPEVRAIQVGDEISTEYMETLTCVHLLGDVAGFKDSDGDYVFIDSSGYVMSKYYSTSEIGEIDFDGEFKAKLNTTTTELVPVEVGDDIGTVYSSYSIKVVHIEKYSLWVVGTGNQMFQIKHSDLKRMHRDTYFNYLPDDIQLDWAE